MGMVRLWWVAHNRGGSSAWHPLIKLSNSVHLFCSDVYCGSYPPSSVSRSSSWRITMRKSPLPVFLPIFVFLLILVSFLLPRFGLAAAQDRDHKPDLLVDDDKVQCPTAAYTSIQA